MSRGRETLGVALLATLPLLPFLDAAVSIDAPVFVAVAEQIVAHPGDPFGFELVWDPTSPVVSEFNHNPPLLSYWLAPFVALFGPAEWAMHLAVVPFSLLAALSFLGIARRLTGVGGPAAWLLVVSPAYLLLATTLLLDVPVLAATLFAVYALLRANEGPHAARWQWASGAAVAAAGLLKYVGFSAAPLLGAGLLLLPGQGARRPADFARVLGVPLLVWAAWGVWTHALYGRVHFLGGLALVGQKSFAWSDFANQALSIPVYYGLALGFPVLAWLASLRRRGRGTELAVVGLLAGAAALLYVLPEGTPARRAPLDPEEGVLGAIGFAGATLVWGVGLWRAALSRRAEDRFLLLWLGGFGFFSLFVNWHVNAADALMAAPPALLLLFRHELRPDARRAGLWAAGLGVLSLVLVASDVKQRGVYRQAAAALVAEIGDAPGDRWSVGQWGFQYYLARQGFRPVRAPQYPAAHAGAPLRPGDWLATARNVSQLDVAGPLGAYGIQPVRVFRFEAGLPLRTTNPDAGGGFYSHQSGFVPFSWSRAPLEEVGLARVRTAPR
ncbi:MAG: ArnT family glycosyltransferase [Myxococcota bacterium]